MSKTYKKWSKEELEFINNNSQIMKDEEIAAYLNKTDSSRQITVGMVRRQRRKLSIVKPRGRRPSKNNVEAQVQS
jgi:hypothetical protein